MPQRAVVVAAALLVAGGCAGPPPAAPTPDTRPPVQLTDDSPFLPPVPAVQGRLALRVVYPPAGAVVRVRDSSFLLGSAGTGEARVTVNGAPVPVWPNGAWLAWVAFPAESIARFRIEARGPGDSAVVVHDLRREGLVPPLGALWIDTTSLSPRGRVWVPEAEYLRLSARAAPGVQLQLRLPDGTAVPLTNETQTPDVLPALRAFDHDSANLAAPLQLDRYVGVLRGRAVGPDPGPVTGGADSTLVRALALASSRCAGDGPCTVAVPELLPPASAWPVVEAIRGADTARAVWPLQVALVDTLPRVVEFHDDSMALPGTADSLTVGRALPGGSYNWFFPTGTRAAVTGRLNDELRIRLSAVAEAWVPAAEARSLPLGVPAPRAVVGPVMITPRDDRVLARVPLGQRVPFRVEEGERTLTLRVYASAGDVDWIRYGPPDPLLRRVSWAQPAAEEVTVTLELAEPVWGYRARWDRADLVLEVRRPPELDAGRPLRGRLVVLDPGHPPGGATGPTGLREAEANLAVATELRGLLEDAGARVLLTRAADVPVDLLARVKRADSAGAELLVSIHNNALPDGVNPFTNHGTTVYYNQPRSAPLAREIQRALVRRLGLRDLGIGRGDLALVRPTWMPSVLTEGLFLILPEQEAALRTGEGRHRYAAGIRDGLEEFLRARAGEQGRVSPGPGVASP